MTKKFLLFLPLLILFLSGCATYSFKKGESPYGDGVVVSRYDRILPEYTIGKDNSVPDEQVARERFERRRVTVESYYKKMGYIKNRFRQNFVDPPLFIAQTVLGVLKLPFIAVDDYKYNHDPKYKKSVDEKEDAEYKVEKERIKALKAELHAYIQEDLKKEAQKPVSVEQKPAAIPEVKEKPAPAPIPQEPKAAIPEKVEQPKKTEQPNKEEAVSAKESAQQAALQASEAKETKQSAARAAPLKPEAPEPVPATKESSQISVSQPQAPIQAPIAVIIAKPVKGDSPLLVQFNGSRSHSPGGRIVSYSWDFGDGDTSDKKSPINTYLSTTYGKSREFTAKLVVTDNKGQSGEAFVTIEVLTK